MENGKACLLRKLQKLITKHQKSEMFTLIVTNASDVIEFDGDSDLKLTLMQRESMRLLDWFKKAGTIFIKHILDDCLTFELLNESL